jgi:outer membrane protein assembly factor BamB
VPPVVGYDGILAMSNDRTVHSLTRGGSTGGFWPPAWVPYPLTGVAHSRSPVVPFGDTSPVFPDRSILFAADDMGDVHAVDAASGQPAWSGPRPQGKPIVGAPGGIFRQYAGVADLIIVGTRDTNGPNELRALAAGDGTPVGAPFTAGGTIGAISGSPAIDYATQRVYFTSRSYNGGSTVWCVQVDGTTPFAPCANWTARNLGDVDGSPVLRGGRVYFGTASGMVYSLDAATGLDDRTFSTGDGGVKGFLFPDRRNDDLIFATSTRVWSVSDTGAATMVENWQWTDTINGLNPSVVLYWPQTNYVYVGSRSGRLYELDFSNAGQGVPPSHNVLVLGDGLAQIGAPSLDIGVGPPDVTPGKRLLVVGSESGALYGVEVPF